jgi:hypothetical protein
MRAMAVKPGMGKFPFFYPFKAELLNQNWMQECASQKRKGLLQGSRDFREEVRESVKIYQEKDGRTGIVRPFWI